MGRWLARLSIPLVFVVLSCSIWARIDSICVEIGHAKLQFDSGVFAVRWTVSITIGACISGGFRGIDVCNSTAEGWDIVQKVRNICV